MPGEAIYSVFVSSTYEDLREERAEVQKALLKLHCMPVGMELFGSADEETWDFIKRQIDGCDYYVVVIADKYGSTDEDGVSYTEKEYDYARELKKPVLSFVHRDRKSIRRDRTEDDSIKRSKLEAFIEKVRGSPVSFFTSPHDLASEVIVSFVNLRDRRPATGFIRADQASDLKKYADLLEENARLREEIAKTRELSERIEASMQRMTIIGPAASRTGLWNVGAREDELGYPPSRFATEVMNARNAVDLCGCTLRFVYLNDVVLEALVTTAARGVPVRILVSGPESPLLAAHFKDSFEDDMRQGSRFLLKRILERNSKINVQILTVKCMTLSILRIDEVMLVMPYLYSVQTSESPHFDVRGSGNPLFRAYQAEFDALFAISQPGSLPSTAVS
jgi:hypothetical protein